MITYFSIKNFAIIKHSEIHFNAGMTTITGDTGAGKSILLDALDILLGGRMDKNSIRGEGPTELNAIFDLSHIPVAKDFLAEQLLENGDNDDECIIRRIIHKDGKSKAFINGQATTATQIKELAETMVSIYSQHAHQALFTPKVQLERLDSYAGSENLLKSVAQSFEQLQEISEKIETLEDQRSDQANQLALLQYQYDELQQLELQADEFAELDERQKELAHAHERIELLGQMCASLYDNDNSMITQVDKLLSHLGEQNADQRFDNLSNLLEQAKVFLSEASDDARNILDKLEVDPERLNQVEQRLSDIYQCARKHKVEPRDLYQHITDIEQQLGVLNGEDNNLDALKAKYTQTLAEYHQHAEKLTALRNKSAKVFSKQVEQYIRQLNIPKGCFVVEFETLEKPSITGMEKCHYMINFNVGQALAPIHKVASGGELSRIGLAIQVVCSSKIAPPTLVFDEVDVGISGGTAEIVGKLLKEIANHAQILVITHQAQVAVQGHQQLHIAKSHLKDETISEVKELNEQQRIEEIAKIVGGVEITQQTLAHATEMYHNAHFKLC